jgi:hypothetical protein
MAFSLVRSSVSPVSVNRLTRLIRLIVYAGDVGT